MDLILDCLGMCIDRVLPFDVHFIIYISHVTTMTRRSDQK